MAERKGRDLDRDPDSGQPGDRPGAVAGGAFAGGTAGAGAGSTIGGITGKAIAERINAQHEDDYWRNEFPTRTYAAGSKYGWADYEPAFRLGYKGYPDHHGRRFDEVEPEFERRWGEARGQSHLEWDEARHATRDAYERIQRSFEWATPGDADRGRR
jgi:hypothetical protein